MKAQVVTKNGQQFLEVSIPMHEPRPSSTGIMHVVASSGGAKDAKLTVNGKATDCKVSITAMFKP